MRFLIFALVVIVAVVESEAFCKFRCSGFPPKCKLECGIGKREANEEQAISKRFCKLECSGFPPKCKLQCSVGKRDAEEELVKRGCSLKCSGFPPRCKLECSIGKRSEDETEQFADELGAKNCVEVKECSDEPCFECDVDEAVETEVKREEEEERKRRGCSFKCYRWKCKWQCSGSIGGY